MNPKPTPANKLAAFDPPPCSASPHQCDSGMVESASSAAASMAFDCRRRYEVGGSNWSEFSQNEDHIVPCPNDTNLIPNMEYSALRPDRDTSPDLPALSASFDNGYCGSMTAELVYDVCEAPNLKREKGSMTEHEHYSVVPQSKDAFGQKGICSFSINGTMQLDGESGIFNNEHEDEEQDNFLDCDWAAIDDFGDLDSIFRDGDTFGSDTVDNGDQFQSQSMDVISSTPMLEDKQNKLLRPRVKAEEKIKNKSSENCNVVRSQNTEHRQLSLNQKMNQSAMLPEYQSPQRQDGNIDPLAHGSYNHSMISGSGYPTLQFPAFTPIQQIQVERNQAQPHVASHKIYQNTIKHSHYLAQAPHELSRPVIMTAQEKIEKLRRRQRMQAIFAIQQQQQKFGHQFAVTGYIASQVSSENNQMQDGTASSTEQRIHKLLPSDLNLSVEHNKSQFSPSVDDHSLEETIYYQLQDALRKLNTGARICFRDSLFRLARSAVDRQIASDRSSANLIDRVEDEILADIETNSKNRYTSMQDAETDTNHIDRTVAHFLFSSCTDSFGGPAKQERP